MVTVSIIILLAVIAVPNLQGFGTRSDFSDKSDEVHSLFDQLSVRIQNPEKNVTEYRVVVDQINSTPSIVLQIMVQGGSSWNVIKSVDAFPNQVFASSSSASPVLVSCTVDTAECLPASPATLTLQDTNFSPMKSVVFTLRYSPFRVVESAL